jgi:hypothetical protein
MNMKREKESIEIAEKYRSGMFATPRSLNETIEYLKLYWPGIGSENRMHFFTALHGINNALCNQLAPEGCIPLHPLEDMINEELEEDRFEDLKERIEWHMAQPKDDGEIDEFLNTGYMEYRTEFLMTVVEDNHYTVIPRDFTVDRFLILKELLIRGITAIQGGE